jgi:hypothetical protein
VNLGPTPVKLELITISDRQITISDQQITISDQLEFNWSWQKVRVNKKLDFWKFNFRGLTFS